MKKYETLDISGDVGLRVFGKSVDEVFINSAIGMYSLITNLNLIEEKKTVDISVKAHSLEGLLISWLNELIFHFDTYGFIGKKIEIMSSEFSPPRFSERNRGVRNSENCMLKTKVYGEDFDQARHESKLLIKAATYHKLKIEKVDDTWKSEIIFDI